MRNFIVWILCWMIAVGLPMPLMSADTKGSALSAPSGGINAANDKVYIIDATGPTSTADTVQNVVNAGIANGTAASGAEKGFLTSADWTTFNSKLDTPGNKTANYVYAGPTSGGATTPTWRLLVAGDIPDLSSSYITTTATAAKATALAANGANCSAGQYPLGVDASGAAESCTAAPTAASLHLDDLLTTVGVASEAVNLGAFTGTTIPDNQTVKAALQTLETAFEALPGGHTQNTDAGTSSATFFVGTAGPKLKNSTGTLLVRNNDDNAYANLTAATITGTFSGNITGNVTGNVTGNADTATTATNATNSAITNDTTTNATMYPVWVTANTGNLPAKVSSTKLTYNPSTGMLSSTGFTGALTGNASTATALAGNPTDCSANQFATAIDAGGNLTCGSVANAATTATANNSASAIVARDGSGNFAAGTITATLSGNASTATNLTGTPTLPNGTAATTQSAGDNSTKLATTAYANALVSDTAYDATSWNAVTGIAPSKNAVRDEIELRATKANAAFSGTFTIPTGITGVLRADSGVVSADTDVTDIVAAASTTVAGKIEIATNAETTTGTSTSLAVTPDDLAYLFARPFTIGSTTPAAGTFTTLSSGGGGFTVDADGDVVGKSFTATRVASTAGQSLLWDAGTGTTGAGWMGPNTAVSPSYYLQLPATQPVSGQVLTAGTPSSNISTMSWTSALVNPMTTQGDIIYGGTSGAATRLAIGSANKVLYSTGTAPAYSAWTMAATVAGTGYPLISDGTNYVAATSSWAPTVSAANMTSFPTLNQNTTGTAAGLTAQYVDWSAGSGGASIANKPSYLASSYVAFGADPADSGAVRLSNNTAVSWEPSTPGTDVFVALDSSDVFHVGQNAASISIGTSGTGNTTVVGDLTVTGNDIIIGSATNGVRLTGGNGLLTIKGEGDGTDEDLTINLNSANVATVSSSTGVTDISLSALNLATTGSIAGGIPITSDNNGMTSGEMTTAGMYGRMYLATGAGTWNLPGAAAGMNFCIYSTTAAAIVINPDNGDTITLNGTALSAGDSITSASGAGDFICLLAASADSWITLGRSGTWTDTN